VRARLLQRHGEIRSPGSAGHPRRGPPLPPATGARPVRKYRRKSTSPTLVFPPLGICSSIIFRSASSARAPPVLRTLAVAMNLVALLRWSGVETSSSIGSRVLRVRRSASTLCVELSRSPWLPERTAPGIHATTLSRPRTFETCDTSRRRAAAARYSTRETSRIPRRHHGPRRRRRCSSESLRTARPKRRSGRQAASG
jgi:hypothetical protein